MQKKEHDQLLQFEEDEMVECVCDVSFYFSNANQLFLVALTNLFKESVLCSMLHDFI